MKTRLPTPEKIDELVAFLPRLYAKGFAPIRKWGGAAKGRDGAVTMPWPEYDTTVEDFFCLVSRECWTDHSYDPDEAGQMLENKALVAAADLAQIKKMLTYCVRGERFCEGHWAAMIEDGHVRRLLQRLAALRAGQA